MDDGVGGPTTTTVSSAVAAHGYRVGLLLPKFSPV